MRRYLFVTAGIVLLVALCAVAATRLAFPSPENPTGPPIYAQISNVAPYGEEIYHTDVWAAIPFYRDPNCVRPEFNLLDLWDLPVDKDQPGAFGCALTIRGFEIWSVLPPAAQGPISGHYSGLGAVPIYFVEWAELQPAVADRILTITDLRAMQTLKVGYASFFSVELHPSNAAQVPHIEISAHGILQEGRQFQFQVAGGDQSELVKHRKIVFW